MLTVLEHSHGGQISSLEEVDENEYSNESGRSGDNDNSISNDNNNDNKSSVLYYERVLIDLFGKEVADSFIHPVIDSSAGLAGMSSSIKLGKKTKSLNKKRFNVAHDQTLIKLTSNAERLWAMLRDSSSLHIEKEDSRIGDDLKISFNAFARSCINRNLTPPQRSFVENTELIAIAKMVNNQRIEKSNLGRRKKQLMFNLSRVQEGNQALLMREKSFLANLDLDYGVKEYVKNRYFDSVYEMIHRLFFPPIDQPAHELGIKKTCDNDQILNDYTTLPPPRGLKFFTAADSLDILERPRGEFRDRVGHKARVINEMSSDKSRQKKIYGGDKIGGIVEREKYNQCRGGKSDNEYRPKKTKQWQPLTLGAVLDFTIARTPTFIDEDRPAEELMFRQGSVRWWRPKLAQP